MNSNALLANVVVEPLYPLSHSSRFLVQVDRLRVFVVASPLLISTFSFTMPIIAVPFRLLTFVLRKELRLLVILQPYVLSMM